EMVIWWSAKVDSQGVSLSIRDVDNLHTSFGELDSSSMMNPSCNQDSEGLNVNTDETIGLMNFAASPGEFTQAYASTMNPSGILGAGLLSNLNSGENASSDTLVHEGDQVRGTTFAVRRSQAQIGVPTSYRESIF
ncbi:hypothetical protein Tco_1573627, partial [Tanacetum coccineum]